MRRHWHLFCQVIDNFGDAGVCLRLARALRARGEAVVLYIDDARPLQWMRTPADYDLPVAPWPAGPQGQLHGPVDGVIEAFGCELPEGVQAQLAQQARAPLWVNLEYLSAEAYAARCHGLPSPVTVGPAKGLVKRFFYPGFDARTGGLLREPALPAPRAAPPSECWRELSLFCYPQAPLAAFFSALHSALVQHRLHGATVQVLGGHEALARAQTAWQAAQSHGLGPGPQVTLELHAVPWLNQDDFDALLRRCDLNVVRGEDSFVRAQWAGRPMLWHIYAQADGVHQHKLAAYLARRQPPGVAAWRALNAAGHGAAPDPAAMASALHDLLTPAAAQEALDWADTLRHGPEWVDSLLAWADARP